MQQPFSIDASNQNGLESGVITNEHATGYRKMQNEEDPNYPNSNDDEEEEDDDDMSLAPSIASSVMTAEGIEDTTDFAIICLCIFIGDMSRGVTFPTLRLLVDELGGSSVTQGYAVGAFSFGRILVSPTFGSWTVTYGYTSTLLFSTSILLVGTLLYAQAQNNGSPVFLICAQTLIGIGSGTLGVTRAFVAATTATRHRTTYMAWITAVQYSAETVTPLIGAFFNWALGDSDLQMGLLRINMYTAPGYFMTCMAVLTLYMLRNHFGKRERSQDLNQIKKKSAKRAAIDDFANQNTVFGLSIYECCIAGCMFLNVATKGSMGCYEAIGISVAESQFDIAATLAGTIVGTCGSFGVFALLSLGRLSQIFTDVQLISGGMIVMASGSLLLSSVNVDGDNPSLLYFLAIFIVYSIGYPIGHTAIVGLVSKIVGRRPQGRLLGWFASAGSLARVLFPIFSGYVEQYFGFIDIFYTLTGVLGISTAITLYNQSTLSTLSQ